jgi:hypothetical protein
VKRGVAIVAGVLILAAVTHVNIEAGNGYGSPLSYMMLAVAAGVGVAALVFGHAWESDRRWLAAGLVLAVIAGEAFNLTATAERLIAGREALQAPLRAGQQALDEAVKRVADAKTAHERTKATNTSRRLDAANLAKAAADEAVIEKSAERGCREHCRHLLQRAVDDAALEVAAAREELAQAVRKTEADLLSAQAALKSTRAPASPTPLADRLGLPAWALDLFHSGLGSIAANGLAFLLIAFGAHRPAAAVQIIEPLPEPMREPRRSPRKQPKRLPTAKEHAARFGVARLCAGEGATELGRIRLEYRKWANTEADGPLADAEIAPALAEMFAKAGIEIETGETGKPMAIGVSLKGQA